jgi:hypothetical protein
MLANDLTETIAVVGMVYLGVVAILQIIKIVKNDDEINRR